MWEILSRITLESRLERSLGWRAKNPERIIDNKIQ
jgi:hypothetical protein